MLLNQRLLNLARQAPASLALTITAAAAGGITRTAQAFFLSRVVSRVFLHGSSLTDVAPFLWLLLALSLLRATLTWTAHLTARRLAAAVKLHLRQRLVDHLLRLGPAYIHGQRTGELVSVVNEGVESLDAYFSQYLPQLALAALVPLTILAFVLPLDLLSGLVLLVTAPLIPVFMVLIGSLADHLTRRQWTALSRMSAYFLDLLQGLTTLKLLGRSREQADFIALISDRFRQVTMSVLRVAFLSALVLELVATISTAIVAVEVGLRLLYGRLMFEQAFFILILAPEFYLPLRLLGTRFHAGMSGVAAARRIFEVLDTPAPAAPTAAKILPPKLPAVIRFRDVHYTYPQNDRPALRGVSFSLEPGQVTALVGPSGAGKTTVAHLLLGFIHPDRGEILVGDTPLAQIDLSRWRAQVAWVPQRPYLFNASVADNIRLGRPTADMPAIREAARLAAAESFIEALPQGYDTLIGERGVRLSGGQAQRLALARAFLKDAAIIVLDEPTASLDPALEAEIQAAIERLVQNRLALVIAHRPYTIRRAGRVVRLNAGQMEEAAGEP